jgi:hypothetical protein
MSEPIDPSNPRRLESLRFAQDGQKLGPVNSTGNFERRPAPRRGFRFGIPPEDHNRWLSIFLLASAPANVRLRPHKNAGALEGKPTTR